MLHWTLRRKEAGSFPPHRPLRCGFVLTFEELAGIIEAKDVDTSLLEVDEAEALHAASAAGRGFAQSGGVAKAVRR